MKQLPEKWAIKTDDPEFYEWVNANKFRTDCSIVRQHSNMYYIHIGDKFSFWSGESHVLPGYEEITIEQWREAVNGTAKKQCGPECFCDGSCKDGKIDLDKCIESFNKHFGKLTEEQKDKLIAPYEQKQPEETGELIGYEAPYDMYNGKVKAGDLFCKDNEDGIYWKFHNGSMCEFPAEWVERDWKPVYKAKEKKRVPKSGWIIYDPIEQRTIFKDGKKDEPFLIQAECIYWVQQNGVLGHYYTFLEVDYITEE